MWLRAAGWVRADGIISLVWLFGCTSRRHRRRTRISLFVFFFFLIYLAGEKKFYCLENFNGARAEGVLVVVVVW